MALQHQDSMLIWYAMNIGEVKNVESASLTILSPKFLGHGRPPSHFSSSSGSYAFPQWAEQVFPGLSRDIGHTTFFSECFLYEVLPLSSLVGIVTVAWKRHPNPNAHHSLVVLGYDISNPGAKILWDKIFAAVSGPKALRPKL